MSLVLACRTLCPALSFISFGSHIANIIQIGIISGGISNALYQIETSASCGLSRVAVRVYGQGTEKFVDREQELHVMTLLHHHGFGAALLGIFSNGRIESFLDMRPLNPDEIASPAFVPAIASALAKLHSIGADAAPSATTTPFARIREWLNVARGLDFSDDDKKAQTFATFDFVELNADVDFVEAAAATTSSPIVFGHNDLLSLNIMVPLHPICPASAADGVTFIDFEYADWTPRGFDWGNHFCEYAGFDCDYEKYPDNQTVGSFIRSYLTAAAATNVSDDDVMRGVAEANVYALAAHMYWGTWAILQARWSEIEFDYMQYSTLRWGEYRRRKDEFIAQVRRVFGVASAK